MGSATLGALFLAGLLGGGHCAAMCGGIAGALSGQARAGLALQLAYNAGRIGSYAAAGAVAGAVGALAFVHDIVPLQVALYVAANVVLVALGLYLGGWSRLLARFEGPAQLLWRRIAPLAARLLPADTLPRALAVGALWGWLPCGLTQAGLAMALLAGGPAEGAAMMAAFGLGTLPNLLAAGLFYRRLQPWLRGRVGRWLAGGLVLGFGVAGLAHAATSGANLGRGLLCF